MHDFSYRLIVTLSLAAGLCAVGRASTEPSDVTIKAAQEEFKSLTIDPQLSGDSKLELPDISGPVTPSNNLLPGSSSQTRRPTLLEKQRVERSKNWLLEAMLEDPSDDGEDSLAEEQEKLTKDPFEQMLAEHLRAKKKPDEKTVDEAEMSALEAEAINPLSTYMTDWISERDRGILLPDTGTDTSGFSAANAEVASTRLPSPDFSQSMSGLATVQPDKQFAEPVVNPYLDLAGSDLEGPSESASLTNPDSFKPAPVVAPIAPPASPAPLRNDTVTPEILRKAKEDKKYFPQLKRF